MARFAYTARDRAGQPVEASLEAPSRKDALRVLSARGLKVVTVSESAATPTKLLLKGAPKAGLSPKAGTSAMSGLFKGDDKPRKAERLPFLEALFDLTTSGLSAGEAVRLLSVRLKEPRIRALAGGLWERLSEGSPLSRAMGDFSDVFDSSTVNLIQAGEATGSLNDTLSRIITHQIEQRELRRQILTAMAYPVLMLFVSGGVILFFLFFLLPRLQGLMTSLGGKMPTSTQILIYGSNFALHWGAFIVLGLVIVGISFWRWRQSESGRMASDAWLLRVPLVGDFVTSQTVHTFSQTLGVLLENGITAVEALRMTERQINNRVHREAFNVSTDRVMEGEALSSALTRTGCFPDLVLDRLAVGENTGNVVPSLKKISQTYQKQLAVQINAFTNILTTGFLLCVFTGVGFIAYAIVNAVFQVSASFKTG